MSAPFEQEFLPPAPAGPPPPPRGRIGLAWLAILVPTLATIAANQFVDAGSVEATRRLERLLGGVQARYVVGAARLLGDAETIVDQAGALDTGSLGQRQRFVVLTAELAGPRAAGERLRALDAAIDAEIERSGGTFAPSDGEVALAEVLRAVYPDTGPDSAPDEQAALVARVGALDDGQRRVLEDELGWLAAAVLYPEGVDADARATFLDEARRLTITILAGVVGLGIAGLVGLAALVVGVTLAVKGSLTSGMGPPSDDHGIYAETFAVWMILFLALQLVAGIVGTLIPSSGLLPALAGFAASLAALLWPVWRGLAWDRVRRDVGLTSGKGLLVEPWIGVGGYLVALPLVGVGLLMTLVLIMLQGLAAGPPAAFDPVSGPAHPIVLQLGEPGWWLKLQVLLLAAVAAPIVEETMFRGVLYRHLRDATSRFGLPLSVLASGMAQGLLFAAIHPQGWVAIPALMGLAWAFALLREWRGTLIPAMIVHGISNGVVMLALIALLGSG